MEISQEREISVGQNQGEVAILLNLEQFEFVIISFIYFCVFKVVSCYRYVCYILYVCRYNVEM